MVISHLMQDSYLFFSDTINPSNQSEHETRHATSLLSSRVMCGVTAFQQRLVVSGKRLALPLTTRMGIPHSMRDLSQRPCSTAAKKLFIRVHPSHPRHPCAPTNPSVKIPERVHTQKKQPPPHPKTPSITFLQNNTTTPLQKPFAPFLLRSFFVLSSNTGTFERRKNEQNTTEIRLR